MADEGNPVEAVANAVDSEAKRLSEHAIEEAKAREAEAAATARAISDAALQSEHAKRIDAVQSEFHAWRASADDRLQGTQTRLEALEAATTAALATLGSLSTQKPVIVETPPAAKEPPVEITDLERAGGDHPEAKTKTPAKRERRAL